MNQLLSMSEFSRAKQRVHYFNEIERIKAENRFIEIKNHNKLWHRVNLIRDFLGFGFILLKDINLDDLRFDLEPLPYSEETISALVLETF